MKHLTHILYALTLCASLTLSSCFKDDCNIKRTYFRYDPVYMTTSDIRSSVKMNAEHELNNPGKIYAYGSLLLVPRHSSPQRSLVRQFQVDEKRTEAPG